MKKTGIIFACIGSAGVGSLITYILTRRHFQKRLEKLVDGLKPKPHEEIRDARNDPDNPFGELNNHPLGPIEFRSGEGDWSDWETKEQIIKTQLEKDPEEATEESEEESEPSEEEVDDISIDPYETTADEFMASEEKMYFTVYKDEVIADDKDKIVRNPEYYIGKDILGRLFSKIGDDPLYVCNPVLNVVIEIAYALDDYGA